MKPMKSFAVAALFAAALTSLAPAQEPRVAVVAKPDVTQTNRFYFGNRPPLLPSPLIALPFGAVKPQGWLRKQLELEADGFTGHLTDISGFCKKEGNAWLNPDGEGTHGWWEEVPYWFRGFSALAYVTGSPRLVAEAKPWIETAIASQTEYGWFGPNGNLGSPIHPAIPADLLSTPDGKPGLAAEYFADKEFKDLKVRRVDPQVEFFWGEKPPVEGLPDKNYSVRWTGRITVKRTGDYVFSAFMDDGARLWVNGEKLFEDMAERAGRTVTASKPVHLEAGKPADLKFEFFQAGGGASVVLSWKQPGAVYTNRGEVPDLMPNMSMLFALRANYEYTGDRRILDLMTRYFRWQLTIPDNKFFSGGWQVPRNGDNLDSVYWLYNRTGEPFLLELAAKLMRTGMPWTSGKVGGGHNVDYAQGFRKPGQFYIQSKDTNHLAAAYGNYDSAYAIYGQVPGGMFGGDEFMREGHVDPQQAIETCGTVDMMLSQQILLRVTGDLTWADRCEDVAFNTLPASFTPDLKALRYLTSPNQVVSDKRTKYPILADAGPMQVMDPFEHRCCQHNSGMGWPYFAQNTWQATPGNGLAAVFYAPTEVTAKVGDGTAVTIAEQTQYPFDEKIDLVLTAAKPVRFPLHLRVPHWCRAPQIAVNGRKLAVAAAPRTFVVIDRTWATGDKVSIVFPMEISLRTWTKNQNSVSVDRGPLTYSAKIAEKYVRAGRTDEWPAWEIFPASPWNYGLVVDPANPARSFEVVKKAMPASGQPFKWDEAPIELRAKAKKIPNWTENIWGTVDALQPSPVKSAEPVETIPLIPMGAGRLRIAAFPVIGMGPDAREWKPFEEPDASCTNNFCPISGLTDGQVPEKSNFHQPSDTCKAFSWWPNSMSIQWVTQKFPAPRAVSSCEVFWACDDDGTCLPDWWKLYYRKDGKWVPVTNPSAYGLEKDKFNIVTFDQITTTAMKLEVQLGGRSGGIFEWRIK